MSEHQQTQTPKIECFRCTNGCFHIVCYNVTLTLNREDFLLLTESMNGVRLDLKDEVREAARVHSTNADSLVM
jgi:hypothetical protein